MPHCDDSFPKTILDGRTYHAVWDSPDRLVIHSKRVWWLIVVYCMMLALLSLPLLILALGAYAEAVHGRLQLLGLVRFAGFGAPLLLCWCLMLLVVVQGILIRRTTLDLQRSVIEVRHLPGFPGDYPLAAVQMVDLLEVRDGLTGTCHLCLTVNGQRGLVPVLVAAGYRNPAYYREELSPPARLLARTIACPLEVSPLGMLLWPPCSLAKWPGSVRICDGADGKTPPGKPVENQVGS